MGRIFFISFLSFMSVISIARPWMGVTYAYLFAILVPQAIWFWIFQDLRPVLWVLFPTFIGFLFGLLKKRYNLSLVRNRRNAAMLILWFCFLLSYFIGPYVDVMGPHRFTDPSWAMSTINKILLLYFIGCLCIDSEKKIKILVCVFIVAIVYLIYWGNSQYLSGRYFGRIGGPSGLSSGSPYVDENNFAMLFVTLLPYLWFAGYFFKQKLIRWGLWLIIPFGWHVIFLTGSRGGLVGVAVSILVMAIRSKKRLIGFMLIPLFLIAYQWQAGDIMKERARSIEDYGIETSASSRLEAWTAALKMISAHPMGVGLASFGPAFPDYSNKRPREAHNTFLQIAAESGILAGAMYLLIVVFSIGGLWRNGSRMRRFDADADTDANTIFLINEATLVSFCGLFVCSQFLSLQIFEIFYCLCLVANTILYIGLEKRMDK